MTKTQQEVIEQGYQALVNSLGVVDAIRFIRYFTPGQGDYTKERHECKGKTPLEDILTSIRQRQKDDATQYEEIIE